MLDDPLIADEVQPTRTVAELVRADERLKKEFPLITLPVLILHGTADKVTKPGGSQLFFDTVGSADKTLKLYEGSRARSAERHRPRGSDGRHPAVDWRAPALTSLLDGGGAGDDRDRYDGGRVPAESVTGGERLAVRHDHTPRAARVSASARRHLPQSRRVGAHADADESSAARVRR